MPVDLHCPDCGTRYAAGPGEPWRCGCGSPLEFAERPLPAGRPRELPRLDTTAGLWAFFELLPIERRVSLGEGFTPLVPAESWDAAFKLEYVFPTGSFKDRGATTTLSRAVGLGVDRVIEDSSGNAGAAIATYAARAGIDADVYVPADVKQSKLMAIQRTGARPIRVEGDRADVTRACLEAVEGLEGVEGPETVEEDDGVWDWGADDDGASTIDDGEVAASTGEDVGESTGADGGASTDLEATAPYQRGAGWYASHVWNPAFLAGTETFAYEVAAQCEWTTPDAIVLPAGNGTLLLGAYRGFSRLREAGIVDCLPRLYAAQAAGYAPIVAAVGGEGGDGEPNELADGIRIDDPARGPEMVEAVEVTDGDAIAVGADAVETSLDRLHRAGFYVEPTCAVAPAALDALRERGAIDADETVVVPLTGSGLKTM